MDEILRSGLNPGEESLSSGNKPEAEVSVSESSFTGESVVEKAESDDASTTSEELQVFNDSSTNVSKVTSPSIRRGQLPPRAPVSASNEQQRVLSSQPSIVRRMMEANKPYVDPKDARSLLPGVLLRSGSLGLEEAIDNDGVSNQAMQSQEAKLNERAQEEALLRFLQAKELERINENLLYNHHHHHQQQRQQQDPLLAATTNLELLANALNEQCRVSNPGGNFLTTNPLQNDVTMTNPILNQMAPRSRHIRSLSEPTFAFPDTFQSFSPFHQALSGAPMMDPNAEALALLGLTGGAGTGTGQSFQQANWSTPELTQRSPTQSLFPNDQSSVMMADLLNQQQQHHRQHHEVQTQRKTGVSRSVDFTAMKQLKRNAISSKDKSSASPVCSGGGTPSKNPTKAEVKKLVEKQTSMGRPTYAPWFRDRLSVHSPRMNTKDDLQVVNEMPPSSKEQQQQQHTLTNPVHNRSISTPGIAFNVDEVDVIVPPPPPPIMRGSPTGQQTVKAKGAGTGVFLPRMPS
eukprot:g252.t1